MPVDGIAGVNGLRIDDHHSATFEPFTRIPIEISAAPCGDRADRKGLVTVWRVTDLAPILDRAGFDEGQGGITPEARFGSVVVWVIHEILPLRKCAVTLAITRLSGILGGNCCHIARVPDDRRSIAKELPCA